MCYEAIEFSLLKGKTLSKVEGLHDGSHEVIFTTTDGETFMLHHIQDCCESVWLESVVGDPDDLVGHEIFVAEESTDYAEAEYGSSTRTFYKLATIKGYVDIRWVGESNGYYSERVDFSKK